MSDDSNTEAILGSRLVLVVGSIFGIILSLGAVALLFGIEHYAIIRAQSLEEGAGAVQSIDAGKVDPANEGKLVHFSGEATTSDAIADPDFGLSFKALRLVREVEVYQWKEKKDETKKGDKTIVTYIYSQVWSKDKPTGSFSEPAGHANPAAKPFADTKLKAATVQVGAFTLSESELDSIPADETSPVTDEMLATLPEKIRKRAAIGPNGTLFIGNGDGETPDNPHVGAARITFKIAKPQTVTVVARQEQQNLRPYHTSAGTDIDEVRPGVRSSGEMFEAAHAKNTALNWILRVVGFVLLGLAGFLILRKLVVDASGQSATGIPLNIGVGVFAAIIALPLVLLVIGIRWLFHQPLIGGGELLVGLLVLGGMFFLARRYDKSGLFLARRKWSREERAAFESVAFDPDNEEPRLELATLLEKAGDPMGEFIRVTNDMESLTESDKRYEKLDERWGELLEAHGRTWFNGLRRLRLVPLVGDTFWPSLWMRNGIIDEVLVDVPGVLPEKADQLFEAAPGLRMLTILNTRHVRTIRGWKSEDYEPDIPAIVALPQLDQIGVLKVSSLGLTTKALKAIVRSENLKNLTELDVSSNSFGPAAVKLLEESAPFKRLRVLKLSGCDLGVEGAEALAAAPKLARLRGLDLSWNKLGKAGMTVLAASPLIKRLQTLTRSHNELEAAGAAALAGAEHLQELTVLIVDANDIGSEGVLALARAATFAHLQTLNLEYNKIRGTGLTFLARSPHLGALEVLELSSNEIDEKGIAALVASPTLRKLNELVLSYNPIGDEGFKALAEWPGLAQVKKLKLNSCEASKVGTKALAASPYLGALEELDLSENEISDAGARALAKSAGLHKIETLWATGSQLSSEAKNILSERFEDKLYTD